MVLVRYLRLVARHTLQLPVAAQGETQLRQKGVHVPQLIRRLGGVEAGLPAFRVPLGQSLQGLLADRLHFILRIPACKCDRQHGQHKYRGKQNDISQLLPGVGGGVQQQLLDADARQNVGKQHTEEPPGR